MSQILDRLFFTVICSFCCFYSMFACNIEKQHLVIAVDNAFASSSVRMCVENKDAVLNAVKKVLDNNHITLSSEDTYYSMVNYGISKNCNNNDSLAVVMNCAGIGKMFWRQYDGTDNKFRLSDRQWYDMIYGQGLRRLFIEGEPFSLQSAAKSYIVKSLRRSDDLYSNRLYLIMVTDDYYNNNDNIQKEIQSYTSNKERIDMFKKTCDTFNDNFKLRHLETRSVMPDLIFGDLKVILYEMIPNVNLSVNSCIDYPFNLNVKRKKGGYLIDFDFKEINEKYSIQHFRFSYFDKSGNRHSERKSEAGNIKMFINKELVKDSLRVEVEVCLRQNDGIYNSAVLSPLNKDFSGLRKSYFVPLRDNVRVLSIIPLPDILWPTDDSDFAELFWTIIILIVVIVLLSIIVGVIIKKMTIYCPDNSKISMSLIKNGEKSKRS